MRERRSVTNLVFLVFLLAGGVGVLPRAQEEAKPAEPAKPLEIPEEERARKNPVPTSPESVEAGWKLYRTQCLFCHGQKGDGQGEFAVELKLTMPDFTRADLQKKRTDGEFFYLITEGHDKMPGQKTRLRPEQKWNLINFIRSLAPPEKTSEKK
jgi:mono/diheme cytochrome c family protein